MTCKRPNLLPTLTNSKRCNLAYRANVANSERMSNIFICEHIRVYVCVCVYISMHYCATSYRMLSTEHYTDIPVYFMCVLFNCAQIFV